MSTAEDRRTDELERRAADDLADQAEAAALARREYLEHRLRRGDPGTAWYMAEGSSCPECGHGPRWHNDPDGCTRMLEGWCDCLRVYLPTATGPDDWAAE